MVYRQRDTLILFLTLSLAAGVPAAASQPAVAAPREVVELSSCWRFQIDARDQGESQRWFDPVHDHTAWRQVEVPRAGIHWTSHCAGLKASAGTTW